jgi:hypothetical protein
MKMELYLAHTHQLEGSFQIYQNPIKDTVMISYHYLYYVAVKAFGSFLP